MPGFGATINIINGGVECNTRDGRESRQASNRIAYYKQFAWYLYVDYENEELGCAKQKQFSAGRNHWTAQRYLYLHIKQLQVEQGHYQSTGTRTGVILTHVNWSTIRQRTVLWWTENTLTVLRRTSKSRLDDVKYVPKLILPFQNYQYHI